MSAERISFSMSSTTMSRSRRADSALYRAKALGKGQVEEWKPADEEPVRQ